MHRSEALARALVGGLVASGVTDLVLSPGSRSGPIAYAAQAADRAGRLRLHVRVDERSAGFLAVGLAKLSRRVVPVVTTSGTAVANLHPPVLEAHHAGVPVAVVSADRPGELHGVGANQTTRQDDLFGTAVRWRHTVATDGAPETWGAHVSRACAAASGALGGEPGPVHLNVQLREPLVPELAGHGPAERDATVTHVPSVPLAAAPAGGAPVPDHGRTLVVLGDLIRPADAAAALRSARRRGWPVVAEPWGGPDRAGALPHGPAALGAGAWLARNLPERVLLVGRPTLSRSAWELVRRPGVRVEAVTDRTTWADPTGRVAAVHPLGSLVGDAPAAARASAVADTSAHAGNAWQETWDAAGARLGAALGPVIAQSWPSGPAVATTVLDALPDGATLFVGSSNPARDVDLSMTPRHRVTCVANRGLAGIDGCVSTAVGVALTAPATFALVGDLTFLHDVNGLLVGPGEPRPDLTVVVVNDDGGGIFHTLEPGEPERADGFERVFGTPTGARVADLCRAYGAGYARAGSPAELAAHIAAPGAGMRVVEVSVPRSAHRDLRARLRAAAAAALG